MTTQVLETPTISVERAAAILGQPVITTVQWATYEFALKFLSPLMLDRMTPRQVQSLITKQKVDFPPDEPLERKAKRKLYSDAYSADSDEMPDGKFVIPADNLTAALRDAGEVVQFGQGKNDRITLSTKGTLLFSMIHLHESCFEILGLDGQPAPWEVDLRKGNATQGTGAVGIVRPRFNEGGIVGHIDVNVNAITEEKIKELFTIAGIRQGLCSARPSKKMPFGQFALTHLEWIGGATPKKASTAAPATTRKGRGAATVSSTPASNE